MVALLVAVDCCAIAEVDRSLVWEMQLYIVNFWQFVFAPESYGEGFNIVFDGVTLVGDSFDFNSLTGELELINRASANILDTAKY